MGTWVDFSQVKEAVTFEQVLDRYGLTMKARGRELSGRCPFHKDTKPSFRVNLDKRVFHCFGCQAKGGVIEFVAALEQVSFRDAALKLQEWFNLTPANQNRAPATSEPKGKSGQDFDLNQKAITRELESPQEPVAVNPPLPFTLKGIDPSHPYLAERGVSRTLAESFGIGFFPGRGSMKGRVVIPIHEQGELVAYAGRAIDSTEPKYLLPANFRKGLFNLHRVPVGSRRLIVVEGFFDCVRLVEAGFINTVALMGTSLSDRQEALLEPFPEIVLMLDNDEAGQNATSELMSCLALNSFVRVVTVPDQPDSCSPAQLQSLLAF